MLSAVQTSTTLRIERPFAYHRHEPPTSEEEPMPLTELNHYFIRANDLEKTKAFYCDVLGFEVMPRPDFPFPGYWLGVNGKIQVHMGPHGIPNSELYYLGTTRSQATFSSRNGARVLLIGGPPFGEAILIWWNFVARTPEEISQARTDWEQRRRFGEVAAYKGARLNAPELAHFARANPVS